MTSGKLIFCMLIFCGLVSHSTGGDPLEETERALTRHAQIRNTCTLVVWGAGFLALAAATTHFVDTNRAYSETLYRAREFEVRMADEMRQRGRYPEGLPEAVRDGWQNEMRYEPSADGLHYRLTSAGMDGIFSVDPGETPGQDDLSFIDRPGGGS